MELDLSVMMDTAADIQKNIGGLSRRAARQHPIRKTVAGSAVSTGTLITPIVIPGGPAVGRVWNVMKIGVFGQDPHSPLMTTTVQNSAFAAGAGSTVNMPLNASLTGVDLTLSAPGTVPGSFNIQFVTNSTGGSANAAYNIFTGVTAYSVRFSPPLSNIAGNTNGIRVTWNATTSAAGNIVVYGTNVCLADFYTTSAIQDASIYNSQGPFPDVIAEGLSIPSIQTFPRLVEWCKYGEQILCLAYNVPTGQQVVASARIADYCSDAVEAQQV